MAKFTIPAKIEEVRNGIDFIEKTLEDKHVPKKNIYKAMLISEEVMVKLIENANSTSKVEISVKAIYGIAKVTMSCGGNRIENDEFYDGISVEELDQGDEAAIRSILLDAFRDKISYIRKGKYNYVYIEAGDKQKVFVFRSALAIILGFLVTYLLSLFVSVDGMYSLADNVLLPIQTLYLNALSLITAPAVFFSIVMAVVRYRAFADPGRVSLKVMIGYIMTTIIAALIGIFTFRGFEALNLKHIGMNLLDSSSSIGATSIIDMITNVIPTNIIDPFQNTDAMQLLFIALITGFAISKISNSVPLIKDLNVGLNKLFDTIVDVISQFIPSQAFFSVMLGQIYFGGMSLRGSGRVFLMITCGFVFMVIVYLLLILIFGQITPIPFIKKYKKFGKKLFFNGEGVERIQDTMEFCKKEMGISNKVSSFSIPFGAIGNLDGNCIYLMVATLFMSKFTGVEILESNIIYMIIIIMILSVGSPITPGSAMIGLTLLMKQMGIPMVMLSVIVVINAFVDLLMDSVNSTGDVAISLIVAKSEHHFDKEVYMKNVED